MAISGSLTITTDYKTDSTGVGTAGKATDAYSQTISPVWNSGGSGTGANQFNKAASVSDALAASTDSWTLSAFPSALGTVAFAAVKELIVRNTGAVALKITPGGSQPWIAGFANDVNIPAGGVFVLVAPTAAGIAVTSGSADKFTVVSAGTTTYEIIIKGI